MLRLIPTGMAIIALILFGTPAAKAQSDLETYLKNKVNGIGGCSRVRGEFKILRKKYPSYHFAFAGRKDFTLSGIRGCGYAWNKNKDIANKTAMQNCKKWEEKYGTAGGKKTCSLLN